MSTITRERAAQIAEGGGFNFDEIAELARIALASLEAEAGEYLTHVVDDGCGEFSDRMNFSLPIGTKLYSAPPAPVSVPDAYIRDGRGRMMLNGRQEPRIGYSAGWNACRAAMLQGADGNSPALPDGWVMVPVEPTAEMLQSGISAHYERSQIQIHDRPAPGPMECAYVAMLAAAPQQEA